MAVDVRTGVSSARGVFAERPCRRVVLSRVPRMAGEIAALFLRGANHRQTNITTMLDDAALSGGTTSVSAGISVQLPTSAADEKIAAPDEQQRKVGL